MLAKLASSCRISDTVVVVAQGYGVPKLEAWKQADNLGALKLLPIQPAKALAHVLATADVLLASIEPDAGEFAVPSKVLSYLCAGRPILLEASQRNLAARIVTRAGAGLVVSPNDDAGFLRAAERLRSDPALRQQMGDSGRGYAERTFDIDSITDGFETLMRQTCAMVGSPVGMPIAVMAAE